jgi:dephospho-CoA kinase
MEVSDDDFKDHWQQIKYSLLRMANKTGMSSSEIRELHITIYDLLTGPITKDDESNIEELRSWYHQDIEIKEMLEQLPKEIVKTLMMDVAQAMENQNTEWQLQQGQYYIVYVVLFLKNIFQ